MALRPVVLSRNIVDISLLKIGYRFIKYFAYVSCIYFSILCIRSHTPLGTLLLIAILRFGFQSAFYNNSYFFF